ncbi:5-formyltetrahydrofolate cyclo-ligase, putative [Perkinsus marinus ATCC 50983]|uniref:5-formyltetrahydrofolate cyclo-ligase n=1 Tax=Perkinsus marinus (strain ATCC 50983 / TXsc) TaxID=423536 RepID=C5KKJ3_PERM5|nr:5-formyltetrahydrofolate cyclo-ligase, putative [Perkinsus marinus ATCC 50983]EER15105.1 5-formyltetrahydrofolate cyclo-ligase, putative [Perkinsus marinus ATCC 50983]|eukprot:XP_002783309.1 5-formyltetrahydrofolate cyclo-ligase, putative [Perkinsus marinus ATCC 50983]
MSSLIAAKKATRRMIKQRVQGIPQSLVVEKSGFIVDKILDMLVWKEAQAVGVFLSMPQGEVQTERLVADAFKSGKRVFVPKTIHGSNDMELLEAKSLNDISSFPRTTWGIPEPDFINPSTGEARVNAMDCRPPALNVILVPGLGFDIHCRRLGRGKGFYDRYLARFSAKTGSMPLLIAPAFECEILDEIPVSAKDFPVDYVVTEERIVERSRKLQHDVFQ